MWNISKNIIIVVTIYLVSIFSFSPSARATTVIWTGGGTDNLASNPDNWSRSIVPQNGDDVAFDSTSTKDCAWDISVAPTIFSLNSGYTGTVTLNTDLEITGNLTITEGALNLNDKNLNVDGYIRINSNGNLYTTSSTITLKGDWINRGNFVSGTSTVMLNGTNQTIYGNNTFYNLIKAVTSADTLYFEAGSIQTIINNLTL
jgi:hypothetical protein